MRSTCHWVASGRFSWGNQLGQAVARGCLLFAMSIYARLATTFIGDIGNVSH